MFVEIGGLILKGLGKEVIKKFHKNINLLKKIKSLVEKIKEDNDEVIDKMGKLLFFPTRDEDEKLH